jgi:hypothetical protein
LVTKISAFERESSDFRGAEASLPQLNGDHKWPGGAEFRGLVLNVPLSSAICP